MQRVFALDDLTLQQPSVVTIGVFDGVHIGHQALVRHLVDEAHQTNRLAVVISFHPHPDVVLRNITDRYYLTTLDEKSRLLADLGVDVLVIHPFNDDIRRIPAADFVDKLLQHLKLSSLWATADFAMGYQRQGNIPFLTEQGAEKGFTVSTIDHITNGTRVSSTDIREALLNGNIAEANQGLGRPYRVSGEIVKGDQRGRTIGFPTANTQIWEDQIIPANGVYACHAWVGDEHFNAVTNIGIRPTFAGTHVTIEAHLLDFEQDIYGETLTLDFLQRLRGEQKFSGIDELVAQIRRDVETARSILDQSTN